MFTGIVEELGKVKSVSRRGTVIVLSVLAQKVIEGVQIGDSIALNGVCLTVTKAEKNVLTFDVMRKTASVTTIGSLKSSQPVNLERSLRVGDRLSGHFVTGHIDCVGIIRKKRLSGNSLSFEIAVPAAFMKFVLPQGSIALDGISLTVGEKKQAVFTVYIIPHTLSHTTLKDKNVSDTLNVEFDILAKSAKNL